MSILVGAENVTFFQCYLNKFKEKSSQNVIFLVHRKRLGLSETFFEVIQHYSGYKIFSPE